MIRNAHPHTAGRVTLVHNGIIENFAELKAELVAKGRAFESQTDTEVVAHLIDQNLEAGEPPLQALKSALEPSARRPYALVLMIDGEDGLVMGARHGPALVVGYGEDEMFLGSDALAVGPFTNRISHLEDGDYVAIDHKGARIFDASGAPVQRAIRTVPTAQALVEKGNYRHFMEKEIYDQPDATQHTLSAYVDPVANRVKAPGLDFARFERLQIIALRHRLLRRHDRPLSV